MQWSDEECDGIQCERRQRIKSEPLSIDFDKAAIVVILATTVKLPFTVPIYRVSWFTRYRASILYPCKSLWTVPRFTVPLDLLGLTPFPNRLVDQGFTHCIFIGVAQSSLINFECVWYLTSTPLSENLLNYHWVLRELNSQYVPWGTRQVSFTKKIKDKQDSILTSINGN